MSALSVHLFQEVHRLQREADEANKRSSVLERDNQRSELQVADMAQQVGTFSIQLSGVTPISTGFLFYLRFMF